MEHVMLLLDADFKTIRAKVVARRAYAPLVEREQHRLRNAEDSVRGRDGAPQSCGEEDNSALG